MSPPSKTQVLISIIIPAYNYAELLPRAVKSVVPQLTSRYELIIVNDGSTDGTEEVVSALKQKFPKSINYFYKKNGGAASARNCGIRQSKGTYLLFLDADDELAPEALAKIQSHLRENPSTDVIVGGHESISSDGRKRVHLPRPLAQKRTERLEDYLLKKKIPICHGATVFHRKVFEQGLYPENFKSSEDIPVFAQALANYSCNTLDSIIALIHKHDDSLRHRFIPSLNEGLALVDEIFDPKRLDKSYLGLKKAYAIQRSLSLFRSAYLAGEPASAKKFFQYAFRKKPVIILRWTYTKKALRLYLGLSGHKKGEKSGQ